MGAGKSLVAKQLESMLGYSLVSTDDEIEKRERRPITDIFRDSGEAYFRNIESDVISSMASKEGLIIDCGGGAVLNKGNIDLLRAHGIIFYLFATPDVIYRRVRGHGHRPLLRVRDPLKAIGELLQQREHVYRRADHTIDTCQKTPQQIADEIMCVISHERT